MITKNYLKSVHKILIKCTQNYLKSVHKITLKVYTKSS
nr:MAG TPA: hypothetical protein [Caudoviricetes sp.]